MKKRKIWTHEKNVILCMTLLVVIYTIALAVLPSHLEEDIGFFDRSWLRYLFQLAKMGIVTLFLTQAYACWHTKNNKTTPILWISFAFVILFLGYYISVVNIQYILQKFSIAVWPLLMLALATKIQKRNTKLTFGTFCYGKALYSVLVLFSIWFVTDVLSYTSIFKRDISDMIYLFGCAGIAWCTQKAFTEKKMDTIKEIISSIFYSFVSIAILLLNHIRFGRIVESLKNPIANTDERFYEVNWLGHRMELMKQIWIENKTLLGNDGFASRYDSSLVLIQQVFGLIVTIAVLAIEAYLIYSLYRLYKEQKSVGNLALVTQTIFYTICFMTGLAFFMELFVVTSSRFGLPLLGNTESFVLILFLLNIIRQRKN